MGVASSVCAGGLQREVVVSSLRSALENKRWISDNMAQLRKGFLHKYIAVNDRKVIANANHQKALFDKLKKGNVDMRVVMVEFITDEGTIWIL